MPDSVTPWTVVPQDTLQSKLSDRNKNKGKERSVGSVPLGPWWPGLGSHTWSLSPESAPSGSEGVGGCGRSVSPRCSWGASCPSAQALNLQVQEGPSAEKPSLLHPKDVEPLCSKSFKKPCRPHVSWWLGPHVQPPSLGSPHLWMKAPSKSLLQDLGCFQGIGVRKEEGMEYKP